MPQLDEILEKRKKKTFIKKSYRPWDLSGNSSTEENVNSLLQVEEELPLTKTSETITLSLVPQEQVPLATPSVISSPYVSENEPQTKYSSNQNFETPIIDNKTDNIQITNRQQIESTSTTLGQHLDNKKETTSKQTDNELDNYKDNNFYIDIIRKIAGLQEKIFFFILEICCARGTLETGVILTADLANMALCSYGSVKMSLKRLIDKGLIIRKLGKRSKGGHINLAITKEIRSAAIEIKREKSMMPIIQQQILQRRHIDNDIDNHIDNILPSSSIYINKTTTALLPEHWSKINIEPLSIIGFNEKHLVDIYETKLTDPEIVQESIYHFAFGLENNPLKYKTYKDPLNVFIGCLRKGKAWYESNYISPREKAIKELIERKKADQARLQSMEEELIQLEFYHWKSTLNPETKKNYLPSKVIGPEDSHLKAYFIENIWPTKKGNLLL